MGQGESTEHRVAALVDVEGTLMFGSANEVNVKLIESLVKKNIYDVYLVADSFSPSVAQLKKLLEKKYHMEVHGVLTLWDITWAFMSLKEVETLEGLINKPDDGYKGRMMGEEFERFVASFPFRHLSSAISSYQPQANLPGQAYQEMQRELQDSDRQPDQIRHDFDSRCRMAMAFAAHLSAKHNYTHCKGLLLDLFLQHLPDWANSVVVCEDDEKALQCFDGFKAVSTSLHVPFLSTIRVSRTLGKRHYCKLLEAHLKTAKTLAKPEGEGGGGERGGGGNKEDPRRYSD